MPVLARLFEKYGVRQIGASLHDQLEGPALEGTFTAIDEFPDIDSARAFWNDPEYQRVIPIRQRFVDAQVVLVGAPSG